jgi:hypothetical protein
LARLLEALDESPMPRRLGDLEDLVLDIEPMDYRTLESQRDRALDQGLLPPDQVDWIAGQARVGEDIVPVHIRLRPDRNDPFQEDKWPFQVRVLEPADHDRQATVLGMRGFSATSPAASGYLNQWLYLEDLRRAGVLAPQSRFVRLILNGEDWGTYLLRESITPELLAAQGRVEGPIVRIDWNELDAATEGGPQPALGAELPAVVQMDEFGAEHGRSDPAWQEQYTTALRLLQGFGSGQRSASEVFDTERMGRYLAHANLWGARTTPRWREQWFYYDPVAMRLEPIGYDAFATGGEATISVPWLQQHTEWGNVPGLTDLAQYNDPQIMEAFVREVMRITQPEYLEQLRSSYAPESEQYYVVLAREFASLDLELPWTRLPERQRRMLASLHPEQPAYAVQMMGALEDTVHLEICNLSRYPIAADKARLNGDEVDLHADWVPESDNRLVHRYATPKVILRGIEGDVPEYVTVRVPASLLDPSTTDVLQLVIHIVGVDRPIPIDVHRDTLSGISQTRLPVQPSLEQALARHPFLTTHSTGPAPPTMSETSRWLALRPGTWEVEGDLILPDGYGLRATEPVTLAFDSGAMLFANAPLSLADPEPNGIRQASLVRLVPQDDTWAGLLVLRTGPDVVSVLRNVEIRGARGIHRDGWRTDGGITFYESPVVLDRCSLRDMQAKAALHVSHATFELLRTGFEHVGGALDADLAQGRVEQCTLHDVRGNGIDATGSTVDIQDVRLLRVYGVGISASQTSAVTAEGVGAADVHIPIASQDMSLVKAYDVQIARAWTAGLAAFRHKLVAGGASLRASRVAFQDDSIRTLVRKGSSLSIDGRAVLPRELDVAPLGQRQETLEEMCPLEYHYGSEIALIGYELMTPEIRPGDTLTLTLYWSALARPGRDYTVFVHIRDAAGQVAVGWDNMPCLDECPTTQWRVGRLVQDLHQIPLPADLPPGSYEVALGLYYLGTGERLPVRDHAGDRALGDGRVVDEAVILEQRFQVIE